MLQDDDERISTMENRSVAISLRESLGTQKWDHMFLLPKGSC